MGEIKLTDTDNYENIAQAIREQSGTEDTYLPSEMPDAIRSSGNGKMDKVNPTGTGSFSLNRKASTTIGQNSFAEGEATTASGRASHAEGFNTIANQPYSHASGKYNKELDADVIAVVGNGETCLSSADLTTEILIPSDAFAINKEGYVSAMQSFSTACTTGYCEYFKWKVTPVSDNTGLFVTLDGDELIVADNTSEYILGVVSAAPAFVANGDCEISGETFVRDAFNVLSTQQKQGSTYRVYDSTYNPTGYVKKRLDPDWSAVCLQGRVRVKQDGTLSVNGYADVDSSGEATSAPYGYRVTKVISSSAAEIVLLDRGPSWGVTPAT